MLGRDFFSSVSPRHCSMKIYPAGIHRGPSGCGTLYLFLRSIQPAGETASLSGHYKSTAVWSLQRRAKLWRSGGEERLVSASNLECFSAGPLIDTLEKYSTLLISQKCVHMHMYMMYVWQRKSSPWHIAGLWGVSPIQFLTWRLTVTWVRCIADQTHWGQQSQGDLMAFRVLHVTSIPRRPEAWAGEGREGRFGGMANQSGTSGSWCLTSPIMWALSVIIRRGLLGTRHLTVDNT